MSLERKRYYVKSGDLEHWVWAIDPINAATIVYDMRQSGQLLDERLFYISHDFIPNIEQATARGELANRTVWTYNIDEIESFNEPIDWDSYE